MEGSIGDYFFLGGVIQWYLVLGFIDHFIKKFKKFSLFINWKLSYFTPGKSVGLNFVE